MNRKFECINCGKQFVADDKHLVECPHCHSDNVEYISRNTSYSVVKWGVIFVMIIGTIGYGISKRQNIEPTDITEKNKSDNGISDIRDVEIKKSIALSVGELTFDEKGYSFVANTENATIPCYLAVMDAFEEKIIATSKDGKFSGVPFSAANGGTYRICVVSNVNDSILVSVNKAGFIRQQIVDTKMTAAELQTKIDARDPSLIGVGENDYLSPDCKLKFIGLSDGATNVPKNLTEVFEKIRMGSWASAIVSSLDYDKLNRISVINITVVEKDELSDDF